MRPWHARRYFFSTCLSLWNKRLVGKEHGVLGLGPFPGMRHRLDADGDAAEGLSF